MMMVFTALALANTLNEEPAFRQNVLSPMDLSVYLACAENGQGFKDLEGDLGVGTFGGSEDHAAILTGRQGFLSLVGFHPPTLHVEIPWPPEWRLAVCFSGARAEKTREAQEKYNLVSRRARDAVVAFNRLSGTRFTALCEAADEIAQRNVRTPLPDLDASGGGLAAGLTDRLRQFILEDRRNLPGAIDALHNMDILRFGSFLSASHRASRKYLWNIAPEIDYLQKSAVDLGAAGASGFGGGFGGSIAACIDGEHAESFRNAWMGRYAKRYPGRAGEAMFFVATPGPGIQVWDESGPRRLVDLFFQERTPLSVASTL